ncbi:HET-domain-containing protein [Daldinia bambusicola]|nr:HET-domain-containing protein [Daldinia bambusicola]
MRLLNCNTMQMKEFFDSDIPRYAILSHTWGDSEVSYQDFQNRSYRRDTCCIDKSSSAELSEAMNSMFHWYRNSLICYAYLSDVEYLVLSDDNISILKNCRWFTRGWTLQELLAPREVYFCSKYWCPLGNKNSCSRITAEITNIPEKVLTAKNVRNATAAQRISWASTRITSRKEDMAYCLLGLLDINMPLLYGEGDKAFIRLQEELFRTTYDHTILAWGLNSPIRSLSDWTSSYPTCLADSPAAFRGWDHQITSIFGGKHYSQTYLGICIDLWIVKFKAHRNVGLAFLDCFQELPTGITLATRAYGNSPFLASPNTNCSRIPIYLSLKRRQSSREHAFHATIALKPYIDLGYYLADFFPTPSAAYSLVSLSRLIIKDETNCQRLFRLCHQLHATLLLFVEPIHSRLRSDIKAELRIAPTTTVLTSWQLLLGPDLERLDFDRLYKSVQWTVNGYLTSCDNRNYVGQLAISRDDIPVIVNNTR